MPITDAERIKDESTVSRFLQQKIPKNTLDGTFETNTNLTQFDTQDKEIIDGLDTESVVIDNLEVKENTDGSFSITPIAVGKTITEPRPTSNLSEYNKIEALYDLDGHVLFFDRTASNNRFHLRHPSGTYISINQNGEYILKAIGETNMFFKDKTNVVHYKDTNTLYKQNRDTNILLSDTVSIDLHQDLSIGGSWNVAVGDSEMKEVGKNSITTTGGFYSVVSKSYVQIEAGSLFAIKSNDTLILDAKTIKLNTGRFIFNTDSSLIETVGGAREISASSINMSASGNVSVTAGGSYNMNITGVSKEVITGASLPPDLVGKSTKVMLGDYNLDVLLGNIIMLATAQGVDIGNLLGKLEVTLTGDVSMTNSMGSVKVGIAGITEIDGTVQVKIGGGAEPAAMGQSMSDVIKDHLHASPVGPTGTILPPFVTQLLTAVSTKVFVG